MTTPCSPPRSAVSAAGGSGSGEAGRVLSATAAMRELDRLIALYSLPEIHRAMQLEGRYQASGTHLSRHCWHGEMLDEMLDHMDRVERA